MDAQHGVVRLHEASTKAGVWVAVGQIVTIEPVIEHDRAKNPVMLEGGVPNVIGSVLTFTNGRELLVIEKPDYVFPTSIWRGAWGNEAVEEEDFDG